MEIFRRIAAAHGTAVVVITHDPRSTDLFDRIVHIEDGRIRASSVERH